MAFAALPAEERYTRENIMLAALSRTGVYKKHGMARVISGVDKDGTQHDEPCIASDMKKLNEGVLISIPDDTTGEEKIVKLRAWIIVVAADYLAAQALLPWYETTGAHIFCRACDADRSDADVYRPFSFLRKPCAESGQAKRARKAQPTMRTWRQIKAVIATARAADPEQRAGIMKSAGLKRLVFALDPAYIPHVDPSFIAPQDILHTFPDGILRSEGAWLFYILFKLGLKPSVVNARIKQYPDWPAHVRIPPIEGAKLAKGRQGGVPKAQSTIRMSGHQMYWFALHSHALLAPLLSQEMREHPAWACWLKLIELFSLVVKHKLSKEDIERIDDLQIEHSQRFDAVPEYFGLRRPKHHF